MFLIVGLDKLFGVEDFQVGTIFIFFQVQKRPAWVPIVPLRAHLASYEHTVNKGLGAMGTADLAFVNCPADDHGAENCFIQDSASTVPLSTSAALTLWRTESNLEIGVGIDPSLREFAAGNQISARGVRLPHYKSAGAAKSICGNRDAASRGFSPATKLCIR